MFRLLEIQSVPCQSIADYYLRSNFRHFRIGHHPTGTIRPKRNFLQMHLARAPLPGDMVAGQASLPEIMVRSVR